ncbi:hypothetical protein L208DRAFT_1388002 [Tricholoma matsutake]|nr:hypothetical protein L208DRAFT_1388002 [Tricholoma matsutake 945]
MMVPSLQQIHQSFLFLVLFFFDLHLFIPSRVVRKLKDHLLSHLLSHEFDGDKFHTLVKTTAQSG